MKAKRLPKTRHALHLACGILLLSASAHAETYIEWAAANNLTGDDFDIYADPDRDNIVNGIEYALASDPNSPDDESELRPEFEFSGGIAEFRYRESTTAEHLTFTIQRSENLEDWRIPNIDYNAPEGARLGYRYQNGSVDVSNAPQAYMRLRINLSDLGDGLGENTTFTYAVGNEITLESESTDGVWEGLAALEPYIRTKAPDVENFDSTEEPTTPNTTKYPSVAGAQRLPVTQPDQGSRIAEPVNWRSWLGWAGVGDSVPPPGIPMGFPGEYENPGDNALGEWDYFGWKHDPADFTAGQWRPIRVDQQPLYLNPWRINYQYNPAAFGWKKQPMEPFRITKLDYWADKKIVRGVNLSLPFPYLHQKGNYVTSNPEHWRQQPLFVYNRPLETLVMVPSNLEPDELNSEGAWNRRSTGDDVGSHEIFPYPVWDKQSSPEEQTPYNLKFDRIGDFDTEIVWEGTNPDFDSEYLDKRYQYTTFAEEGLGNYFKMHVTQGSPFVWCESHNNKYMIFYNLIRGNTKGNIDDYGLSLYDRESDQTNDLGDTGAKFIEGEDIPGVPGVKYVLAYGNQRNPNQFYQEVEPIKWDIPTGRVGSWNPPGTVSNHTYIAIFYNTATVTPMEALADRTGEDTDGNRYFFLEFTEDEEKNWFVVGSIPVMRYYDPNTPEDSKADRLAAAHAWAKELGKYAFNFPIGSRVDYDVTNMYQVETDFRLTLSNPFVESGAPNAADTTAEADKTVINLLPHQYQPITLGPDLTQSAAPEVVWPPLRSSFDDFPSAPITLANANLNPKAGETHWGYWTPKGNLKPIVAKSFKTVYPFQNFLPVQPPADFADGNYEISGIPTVRVIPPESGNDDYKQPVDLNGFYQAVLDIAPENQGENFQPAELKVLIEPNTDQVKQIDVVSKGNGYPTGNPPPAELVSVVIDAPIVPGGVTATAYPQINGNGGVDAVFMIEKGSGYRHIIEVDKQASNSNDVDSPIILPAWESTQEINGVDYFVGLKAGLVDSISSGYGYQLKGEMLPTATINGTGTGATVEVLRPGQIIGVENSNLGAFTSPGGYPSTGDLAADSAKIQVHIPPPPPLYNPATDSFEPQTAPAPEAAVKLRSDGDIFQILVDNPGSGFPEGNDQPMGSYKNLNGDDVAVKGNVIGGKISSVAIDNDDAIAERKLNVATKIDFDAPYAGVAEATAYPKAYIESIEITTPSSAIYPNEIEVGFSGGTVGADGFEMPVLDFEINQDGTISLIGDGIAEVGGIPQKGAGFNQPGIFLILGGKGFNAALAPIISADGKFLTVKVIHPGSNYPEDLQLVVSDNAGAGATFDVQVENGEIKAVEVTNPGSGYTGPSVFLRDPSGTTPLFHDAKGKFQAINFGVDAEGGITAVTLESGNPDFIGTGYVPGSEYQATVDSLPAYLSYFNTNFQALSPADQARGYLAVSLPFEAPVEGAIYDSATALFSQYAAPNQSPFGAGYANGSPDGYGLGNTFSSIAKTVGLIYNLYQHNLDEGRDLPNRTPSRFLVDAINATPEFPVYRENSPLLSLRRGLKTSVQGLQYALTLLFTNPPFHNSPEGPRNWAVEYFNQYDGDAYRVVVNPTATLPTTGVASSVYNPATIPDEENEPQTDPQFGPVDPLSQWTEGKLFSGFGVSDQWTDQHYFFGYYLSTAGIAAVLEGAWLTDEELESGKPAELWSAEEYMGTAIDQWLMTYAYDPDISDAFYKHPAMRYQKFAFFDRYNGHPWATGTMPPDSVAVLQDPVTNEWNEWRSWGIHNGIFGDENENSSWEGLQSFSAAILWGAGTDRREIVDLGIYLLATGQTAGDMYFLDKNYNLKDSEQNDYSWTPTVSAIVTDDPPVGDNPVSPWDPSGGNSYSIGDDYTSSNPAAFYGNASAGSSIQRKYGPTVDTFFYSYPAGPKFIQAFPPTHWTLGISRNTTYMKHWANVFVSEEWAAASDSGLYQPAIWNALSMTSALSGVPQLPGDSDTSAEFADRAWSSWYANNRISGDNVTTFPNEKAINIMSYLHTMQEYGTPDWTIYARVINGSGDDSGEVVFTAAFSKPHPSQPNAILTTLVAFNPGWTPASVNFLPILADGNGTLGNSPINGSPIEVKPKRMVLEQVTRPIQ